MAGVAGAGGSHLGGLGSLLAGKGVAAIVAGLVVGAATGGALVASGTVQFNGAPSSRAATGSALALVPCPDQGPVVGSVTPGQQVLVTGRTTDSAWLELYYPAPGITRAWTRSGPLQLQGDLTSLPVHACDAPSPAPSQVLVAVVSPSPAPSPSPATSPSAQPSLVVQVSPSPSPQVSPSPPPTGGPKLSGLAASTRTLYYDQGSYCPSRAAKTVAFSIAASDPRGVSTVTLFWRTPSSAAYQQRSMTRVGSRWSATLSSATDSITTAGSLLYYVQASNAAGTSSKAPGAGAAAIAVSVCKNTGPTISAASAFNPLYWNPLGASGCQSASNMTATAKDVDGIQAGSVMLHWRRPGSSAWQTKPMVTGVIAGKYYANLDTLGDSITITKPPTGSLAWYVTAQDKKGVTGKSSPQTITIKRCDTAATIRSSSPTDRDLLTFCPPATTGVYVTFGFGYLNDPDGLTSVAVSYAIQNSSTGRVLHGSASHSWSPAVTGGTKWSFSSVLVDGDTYYGLNTVTWTITTTDQYGHHTSAKYSVTVNIQVC